MQTYAERTIADCNKNCIVICNYTHIQSIPFFITSQPHAYPKTDIIIMPIRLPWVVTL